MKKIIVLLSIVVLFLSGCSAYRLDCTDLGSNIKILLSEKVDIYNVYFDSVEVSSLSFSLDLFILIFHFN